MLNNSEYIYSNPNSESQNDRENNIIPFINYQTPAPARCLDMLLAKYYDHPYQTEVVMKRRTSSPAAKLRCKLKNATIMLITDGGLVPIGNPDRIPSSGAKRFGVYSFGNPFLFDSDHFEVNHQGYDNSYVEKDPNRLLPVDALQELVEAGLVGALHPSFISTAGVMTSEEISKKLGEKIANYVNTLKIDAVILTSACGTSTRCGSLIGKEIEKKGIPVVQVTNLTRIAEDNGISRVIKGRNVSYPFGHPAVSSAIEYEYRRSLVLSALELL